MMIQRWRGLKDLICDAVEHGSRAVEQLQRDAAKLPFAVLEEVPLLKAPARAAHELHDMVVSNGHRVVRLVNRIVRDTADIALDAAQARGSSDATAEVQEP